MEEVYLLPSVDEFLRQICIEKNQPWPDAEVRRELASLSEELAHKKVLQIIYNNPDIKSLGGFIMHLVRKCSSPSPSPSKTSRTSYFQSPSASSIIPQQLHFSSAGEGFTDRTLVPEQPGNNNGQPPYPRVSASSIAPVQLGKMSSKAQPSSKESKQISEATSSTLVAPSPNNHSILGQMFPVQNSFIPLRKIPQTYAQQCTHPNTIEAPSIPSPSKPTTSQRLSKNPYIVKLATRTISFVEPEITGDDPYQILKQLTYPNYFFVSKDPSKNKTFYEFVLVDTDSIVITHYMNDGQITHSKMQIKKVLTLADWNQHPMTPRRFSQNFNFSPSFYTYWDYVDAWENVLYIQNKGHQHSWFIFFCQKFRPKLPYWFKDWWFFFGATEEILPPKMAQLFKFFEENFERKEANFFDALFMFFACQNVTWIFSWDILLTPPNEHAPVSLIRRYKVKWWDGFPTDKFTEDFILKWFKEHPQYWNNRSIVEI